MAGDLDGPLPVSAEVRRVVGSARSEAHALGATVVGPEHLLLAILRSGDRHTSAALRTAGLGFEDVRREAAAGGGTPPSPSAARHVLARAVQLARRDHAERVEVEHVLRGVLETMDAGSGSLLRRLRVPAKRILGALEEAPAAKAAG